MTVIDQIGEHLQALNLRSMRVSEDCIVLGFSGEHLPYRMQIHHREPLVTMVTMGLVHVPKSCRARAMELPNTLNATKVRWGLFGSRPKTGTWPSSWGSRPTTAYV